jgi:3-oxoacyl-(acyl-carrier-protein) synthase
MRRCISGALSGAGVDPREIDYINGHLTSTAGDLDEVRSLVAALGREGEEFPWVNSTKSLIGHALGAAGSIESVATALQLHEGFLHISANSEDVHPEIAGIESKIVRSGRSSGAPHTALKTSFGFGDANVCLVFRRA